MKTDIERRSRHEQYRIYGAALVLVIFAFWLAFQFVEPAPPRQISIATGNPDNAYYNFALKYRHYLQQQGIELEVLKTAGSVENLDMLRSGRADIAFVQGGTQPLAAQRASESTDSQDSAALDPVTVPPEISTDLHSLASLYYEPLWVFTRKELDIKELLELRDKRLLVGAEGSGTRPVALTLLADNDINENNTELLGTSVPEALQALRSNDADALFLVSSADSSLIQTLLRDDSLQLMDFNRAEGYQRLHPFLSQVVLPAGVIDMAAQLPAQPVDLVAPAATLVVREDFHPALAVLMLQAATRIHSTAGLFEEAEEFPSGSYLNYPLLDDAQRFLDSGPPFLQRYLPFWAANLVDRLMVMLVPLITLLIPLSKILPPTYSWRIRSRIYRWYDQLRDLDFRAESISSEANAQALLEELEKVEKEVMQVTVPKSYADNQYNLRLHIRLIRDRIERLQQAL